jgi:hypothetical protein
MATIGQLSINDVLGAPNLLGLIQTTKSGIPPVFPDEFYTVDDKVFGNQGTYFPVDGTRKTATITTYGGPPTSVQGKYIGSKPVVLLHSYEELNLNPLMFQNLLNYKDLSRQRMGAAEVARQVREFKKRMSNLRIAAMVEALFTGQVIFDGSGNLLAPGSVVPANGTSVNYGYPTNNGTAAVGVPSNIGVAVDPLGTGTAIIGSAAGSWATATTNISQQTTALKQAAIFLTGYEITNAFYGKNVPSILANNTNTQAYMARDNIAVITGVGPTGPTYIRTGEIPDGVLGFKWHKAYQGFFKDQNGNNVPLVGDNQILFTPDYSTDWLGTIEGSYTVPNNVWKKYPDGGTEDAMSDIDIAYGMFLYSVQCLKPPTATFVVGDTFLPVLKNPLVNFVPTVA